MFGPVAAEVGLQLLLRPYSSALGEIACTVAGVIYPCYSSFRAVELLRLHGDPSEAYRWLTYWGVYGCFASLEKIIDGLKTWLPYYSVIKLAFILWLHLPQYSGAARLSRQLFRPLLRVLHPYITVVLNALEVYRQRPEVLAAENVFHGIAGQIPVLEWFIRGPDGRPRLRPNRKTKD